MNSVTQRDSMDLMYDLLTKPRNPDVQMGPKGWKSVPDLFVPLSTEGRKAIYGNTALKKIQMMKVIERMIDVVFVALPIGAIMFLSRWAQLGMWSKQAQVALAGGVTEIFGTPPTDLTYYKPKYLHGDGCPAPSPGYWTSGSKWYYFKRDVKDKLFARKLEFALGIIGAVTVLPLVIYGTKWVATFFIKRNISNDLEGRIADLRNRILLKELDGASIEKIRYNEHNFKAHYKIVKTKLLDVFFDPHLLGSKQAPVNNKKKLSDINAQIELLNLEDERKIVELNASNESIKERASRLDNMSRANLGIIQSYQKSQEENLKTIKALKETQQKRSSIFDMHTKISIIRARNAISPANCTTLRLMHYQEKAMTELEKHLKEAMNKPDKLNTKLFEKINRIDVEIVNQLTQGAV